MKRIALIVVTIVFCLSLILIPVIRAENREADRQKGRQEVEKKFVETDNLSLSQLLPVSTFSLLSGTKTIGPSGDYTSIGAAIADIQTQGLDGALILELLPNYSSGVETFPLNFSNLGTNPLKTITVRPQAGATDLAITGNNATAIINLDGGQFVIFEGRPGGAGTEKELTIENTNTSTAGATVRFINEASNNIFRHIVIRGATTGTNRGVVFFSTTTGANGNDNNTIENSDIRDGVSLPRYIIFSQSTSSTLNDNNQILNNNIFNFHSSSGDAAGVRLNIGNAGWTISGNNFFQTVEREGGSGTIRGIHITSGSTGENFSVSNNFIGGSQTNAGGAAWTNSGTAADSRFVGIHLNVSSTTPSSLQGNVIRNIVWETSGNASVLPGIFSGIFVQQGAVNIGTTAGNFIGGASGTGSINVTTSGDGGTTFGIGASGFPDRNIFNNTIGSITTNGTNTSVSASLIGIQATNGINTISGNNIGSNSTADSFNAATSSTSAIGQKVIGIQSTNFNGAIISNNIIANLNNNYAGNADTGQIVGIVVTNGSNTITGNTVRNLTTTSLNTGIGANACMIGISQNSTSSDQTISQNKIQSLNYNGTISPLANPLGSFELLITGIYMKGASLGSGGRVTKNSATEFRPNAGAFFAVLFGMVSDGNTEFRNNLISHGIDVDGKSITTPVKIHGIHETSGSSTFDNNSVRIGGENVQAGPNATFAFSSDVVNEPRRYRGNLFTNFRTNAAPGGGFHSAIRYSGTGFEPLGLSSDSNIFYVEDSDSPLGFYNAIVLQDIQELRRATGTDASSGFADPIFVNPFDLHLQKDNPAAFSLLDVFDVNEDFDGDERPDPPNRTSAGADENLNFTLSLDIFPPEIKLKDLSNGSVAATRTLTNFAEINDNVGVTNTRIYYKKSVDADVFLPCNCSSENGWKHVSATNSSSPFSYTVDYSKLFNSGGGSGSVSVGDRIDYFLVADDAANNLSSSPAGAGASANPPVMNIHVSPAVVKTVGVVPSSATEYIVGKGALMQSLTNDGGLFDQLNNNLVATSDLTIRIISDLPNETGTHAAKKLPSDDPNTVFQATIVPEGPTPKLISGNGANGGLLRFDGAEQWVLDGRFSGTGNFIRVRNTNPVNPTVRINNGSRNLSFINWAFEGENATSSGVFNITASGNKSNEFIKLDGVTIRDRSDGGNFPASLFVSAGLSGIPNKNVEINNSNFINFTSRGIEATSDNESFSITGNRICPSGTEDLSFNPTNLGGSAVLCAVINIFQISSIASVFISGRDMTVRNNQSMAISTLRTFVGTQAMFFKSDPDDDEGETNVIEGNRYLITTTPDSVGTITGIQSFGGGPVEVKNNQVTIVVNGSDQRAVGILNDGFNGGSFKAYNNTALITGTAKGTNQTSAAERGSSANTNDEWLNNVWFNFLTGNSSSNFAMRRFGDDGTFTSDHNLFVGTGNPNSQEIFEDRFQSGDFSDWKTSTGSDLNSIAGVAGSFFKGNFGDGFAIQNFNTSMFVDPLNGNLNINTGTEYDPSPIVSNRGTPVAEVTTDFEGKDTRHPLHPDIGSDEFDVNRNLINDGMLPAGNYDNITVNNGVTATLGGITNIGGTFLVECSGAISGVSATNYIIGNVGKNFCTPGAFEFPVGTNTGFSPVDVNITNLGVNPSALTIKANDGIAPANPPLNNMTTLNRFWTINETGDLTANLLFNYLQTDVFGDESQYQIFRLSNSGFAEFFENNAACDPVGPVTNVSPCVYWNGPNQMFIGNITDFSDWSAGVPFAPTSSDATIRGRVTVGKNTGVKGAVLTLTGGTLISPQVTVTNQFGNFAFKDIEIGHFYVLTVQHKKYGFIQNSQGFMLLDNMTNIVFHADWEN